MSIMTAAQALQEVKQYEGENARIINDWYSRSEYVKRRHPFLSKPPDYQSERRLDLNVTKGHANLVFPEAEQATSDSISVQEVRRRELTHELFPLLPLPTTNNMNTLDDFKSYPESEWWPGWKPTFPIDPTLDRETPPAFASDDVQHRTTDDQASQPTSTQAPPGVEETFQTVTDGTAAPAIVRASIPNEAQAGQTGFERPAIDDGTAAVSPGPFVRTPDASPQVPVTSGWTPASAVAGRPVHVPVKPQRGTKRKSPESDDDASADAGVEADADPDPGVDVEVIIKDASPDHESAKGNPNTTDEPAGRPAKKLKLSVKQPESAAVPVAQNDSQVSARSTRQRSKTPAISNKAKENANERDPAPASGGRSKTPAVGDGAKKTTKASSHSTGKLPATSPGPSTKITKKASRKKTATPAPSREPSAKPAPRKRATASASVQPGSEAQNSLIERIARGEILPKTAALATQASALRLQRLRSQYAASNSRTQHHPDFPPEFFDTANFSRLGREDIVRCICGAKNDGGVHQWIGCDAEACQIWQHQDCVKDALPEDLDEGEYLCHMCDPYTHRKALQRIRKRDGIP